MAEATDRLAPPDDASDLSGGEMFREVIIFAIVIGTIAGGGYGIFAGYNDWSHAAQSADKKSALIIPLWGLAWAAGGAVSIALLCGAILGFFLGAAAIVRRIAKR